MNKKNDGTKWTIAFNHFSYSFGNFLSTRYDFAKIREKSTKKNRKKTHFFPLFFQCWPLNVGCVHRRPNFVMIHLMKIILMSHRNVGAILIVHRRHQINLIDAPFAKRLYKRVCVINHRQLFHNYATETF